MKIHSAFLLCLIAPLHAQVYTPPPGATPQSGGTTQPAADTAPAAQKPAAPSPFGQEVPLIDPSAETLTLGGITIPLGDNRVLKARFEKFLSQPPEDDDAAEQYRSTIKEILDTIAPLHPGGPNLSEAFKLLPSASTYPGDANLCGSLAESIYTALLAKQDIAGLRKVNSTMEKEKNEIMAEGDWAARHETEPTVGQTTPQGGGKKGNQPKQPSTTPGRGVTSLKYANTLRRIAEIEALKKANIVKTEAQTIKTKAQYQVNMIQWFVQRRYEHVLMAARFYNQIWKDGDSTLRIDKNSDVAKLFSESVGVNPTVSSLDSLSNEAIREVSKYIKAFNLMLDRNELHSASQRLMEAYALGEYLAPVATLSLEKKQRIASYVRDLHELYGTLQARDYTKASELAASLKKTAKDFPSSKVDSAIAAYSLASDLAIEEAKAHLLSKENDKASEKIRSAAEIWPTNPKLSEFRTLVAGASPLVIAKSDFDRLIAEGNFREIFRRQYEIAPAIRGDAAREESFKQIITNLTQIEAALAKATEFGKMGQHYAAWEQLAELRTQFPDDPKLGRELELLAPQVADFTKALDQAGKFESANPKQPGSALSWYLKARALHPQSTLADEGIKRLSNEILPAAP
ncbi:MAG: hypothetical protein V4733_01945 [Verrucomicrobiota bacterium]